MNVRSRWIGAALVALLAAGCASGGRGEGGPPLSGDVAVQAAALRWLFDHNDSRLGSSAASYCVGVGSGLARAEPPWDLVRALRDVAPRVEPLSSCGWGRDPALGWRVIDRLSEAPALAFLVSPPTDVGEGRADIYAEYVESARHATGYDCRMERDDGKWRVDDCRPGFPR